jgi:hypothetical protein
MKLQYHIFLKLYLQLNFYRNQIWKLGPVNCLFFHYLHDLAIVKMGENHNLPQVKN